MSKSEEIRRVLTHYRDKERYYKKVISKRLVSYDKIEPFIVNSESNFNSSVELAVEEKFKRQTELKALKKALTELSDDERQIINECFFADEKSTYTDLAKQYGITRQAYCKRLHRILRKMRSVITEEISNYN